MPDYRGSDEVRRYVLPVPWVVYRLDWLKVDRSGVRSIFFESDRAEVNFSMTASPPVRSDDNRARRGMENLRPLVEAGPSLDVRLWRSEGKGSTLKLLMPLRGALTLESRTRYVGVTFSPSLNLDVGGIGGGWNLGLVAGPVFASGRQDEYYYGVPEKDALPGRPAYDAPSGYGGTQFLASVTRRFGNVWLGAFGRYDTLQGASFEESPLVRRDWYASGGIGLAYVFARSEEKVEQGE
jgi:outer membrane scaffolding protein for murein synthesis (MipA/OmpV family)